MTQTGGSFRALVESARAAARSVLSRPTLYSALIRLERAAPREAPGRLEFGFHDLRHRLILGKQLKVCWVTVSVAPRSVTVSSVGTFGRQQFKQLASLQGMAFPPPPLELDGLRVEPADVLRILEARPLSAARADLGTVDLSLCHHDGQLAWRVLQDMDGVAVRTMFLDTGDGHVVFEKVDRVQRAEGRSEET